MAIDPCSADDLANIRLCIRLKFDQHPTLKEKLLKTADHEIIEDLGKRNGTRNLVDGYVAGKRDRYSMNAAYILRDTLMVIGGKSIAPASCAFFYDDMNAPMAGGTGHTMNVCRLNSIPYWDQRFWRNWL